MKIVIFGNSGSGKTTLANDLKRAHQIAHLDLDTLAWENTNPPQRKPLTESKTLISQFIQAQHNWVIEGCYADLIEMAIPYCSELIFINLCIETCIENAKKRPWEPHKYKSKQQQDANLGMLIDWISDYQTRTDSFSYIAHKALYDSFSGPKKQLCNLS